MSGGLKLKIAKHFEVVFWIELNSTLTHTLFCTHTDTYAIILIYSRQNRENFGTLEVMKKGPYLWSFIEFFNGWQIFGLWNSSQLQGLEVRHNNFFLWLFYLFRFLGRLCACLLNFFYLFEWCKLWLKYQLTFSNLYRKKIQIKKYLEDFLKRDNGNEKRRRIRIERDNACRVTFVSRYIFRQTSGVDCFRWVDFFEIRHPKIKVYLTF